jgi:acetyl-CoA carboxylase carboxyl transferase subunit beta
MSAWERLEITVDPDSFQESDEAMTSLDPLNFDGYPSKIRKAQDSTNLREAAMWGSATLEGRPLIFGVIDFRFLGGSMGSVVGEKITRAAETALDRRLPLVVASAGGGGARMHEGMLSLMQMAKTSAAAAQLKRAGLPYISIITHPTMGGVAASFAALGDVIIAEPGALIGFAGPRVIEQTIGQRLPEGFQRAEFLLSHGMIDMVVPRSEIRRVTATLLRHLCAGRPPSTHLSRRVAKGELVAT